MIFYILLGIIIVVLIYAFITYNSLIKLNNKVKETFATMDVYFKKRWDLIPNIVEIVKGYAKHEKVTLESIVKLRNVTYEKMTLDEKIYNNTKMSNNIGKLMVLVEKYPNLKANNSFIELSSQLSLVEEDIANSRKYYNAVIRNLNNKIQMFPSSIFAKMFKYKEQKYFMIDEKERENIGVDL